MLLIDLPNDADRFPKFNNFAETDLGFVLRSDQACLGCRVLVLLGKTGETSCCKGLEKDTTSLCVVGKGWVVVGVASTGDGGGGDGSWWLFLHTAQRKRTQTTDWQRRAFNEHYFHKLSVKM